MTVALVDKHEKIKYPTHLVNNIAMEAVSDLKAHINKIVDILVSKGGIYKCPRNCLNAIKTFILYIILYKNCNKTSVFDASGLRGNKTLMM